MKLLRWLLAQRVFRFVCVGGFNTILDLVMLNILVLLVGLPVLVANTISVTIGITISFFLNRRFVFQQPRANATKKQFAYFFIVTGASVLLIQNIVIYIVEQILGVRDIGFHGLLGVIGLDSISNRAINLNVAKALAVLVGMVWNFTLYSRVVFTSKSEREPAEL